MLRKKVEIDGREIEFKASAAVPRIYRIKFRRDLFVDLQKIAKSVDKKGKKKDKESSEIPIEDLELSVRAFNCLKRADINTLDQLTAKSEDELTRVRNLGKKSVDEIKAKLSEFRGLGLHLRDPKD